MVFKKDKVFDVRQQTLFGKQAKKQGVHLEIIVHDFDTVDAFPGGVPLGVAVEHSVLGFVAVAYNRQGVVFEQKRNVFAVMLYLVEGFVYGSVFVEPVFEFKQYQRNAVDVNDNVGTAFVFAYNTELIDTPKHIVFGILIINRIDVDGFFVAYTIFVFITDSFGEFQVETTVAVIDVGTRIVAEVRHGKVLNLARQLRILLHNKVAQLVFQYYSIGILWQFIAFYVRVA